MSGGAASRAVHCNAAVFILLLLNPPLVLRKVESLCAVGGGNVWDVKGAEKSADVLWRAVFRRSLRPLESTRF